MEKTEKVLEKQGKKSGRTRKILKNDVQTKKECGKSGKILEKFQKT